MCKQVIPPPVSQQHVVTFDFELCHCSSFNWQYFCAKVCGIPVWGNPSYNLFSQTWIVWTPSVIGCISYFLFGYAFAFGQPSNGFIGGGYFALAHLPPSLYSMWFFQFVFAATAATIVSGAMAERTDFLAYVSYSIALTGKCKYLFPMKCSFLR